MAAGKRIIHVGCVDHSVKKINVKLKHGQWVHKILCDAADRCVGIDIIEDCITHIRDELGYEVYAGDILTDAFPFLDDGEWDAMFIPEVVEHLDNPVDFLTRLRERLGTHVSEFIVSVPNAASSSRARYSRRRVELTNTDHRYSFTPYTLAKIASVSGYRVVDFSMCASSRISRRRVFRNWFLNRHPLLRDNILMRLVSA